MVHIDSPSGGMQRFDSDRLHAYLVARCSDLSITPVMTAYASFYASFESRVRWPALIVRGMGLGEMGGAALAIGMVAGGGRG